MQVSAKQPTFTNRFSPCSSADTKTKNFQLVDISLKNFFVDKSKQNDWLTWNVAWSKRCNSDGNQDWNHGTSPPKSGKLPSFPVQRWTPTRWTCSPEIPTPSRWCENGGPPASPRCNNKDRPWVGDCPAADSSHWVRSVWGNAAVSPPSREWRAPVTLLCWSRFLGNSIPGDQTPRDYPQSCFVALEKLANLNRRKQSINRLINWSPNAKTNSHAFSNSRSRQLKFRLRFSHFFQVWKSKATSRLRIVSVSNVAGIKKDGACPSLSDRQAFSLSSGFCKSKNCRTCRRTSNGV